VKEKKNERRRNKDLPPKGTIVTLLSVSNSGDPMRSCVPASKFSNVRQVKSTIRCVRKKSEEGIKKKEC